MNSESNVTNVYDSNQKTNHMYIDGGNSSSHSSPPPPGLDVAVEAILDCLISKSEDLSVPGSTPQAVPSPESDDIPGFGETNFPCPTAILANNDNEHDVIINNATTPPASTSGINQPEVEVPVGRTLQLQPPSTSTTQWHVYVHDLADHVAIDMDQLQFIVYFESEAEHEVEVDEDEDEDEDEDSEDFESDDDYFGGYQTEFKQVHNGRPVLKLKV